MGKGRRQRVLPLWAETRTALVDWLSIRPAVQDRYLFLNVRGQAMTRQVLTIVYSDRNCLKSNLIRYF